ncbi:N-acetyltransferase [Clostridia bacterium]|nr:N-acetyltransferase [Clostridia bacterium]
MIIPIGTLDILTDRLFLRRFEEDDAPHIYNNWASDPEVTRYLTWKPHRDIDETKEFVRLCRLQYDSGYYFHWAVCLDGIPIGSFSLISVDITENTGEIGYCFGKEYWGKGYAPETAGFCREYFLKRAAFDNLTAKATNPRSKRVLEKVGFKRVSEEGELTRFTLR